MQDDKPLLSLVDGDILNFSEEHSQYSGCETCDFGSSYLQDFNVTTTKGNMRFDFDEMYDYLISHDFMFRLILPRVEEIKKMTIMEFYEFLVNAFKKECNNSTKFKHSFIESVSKQKSKRK